MKTIILIAALLLLLCSPVYGQVAKFDPPGVYFGNDVTLSFSVPKEIPTGTLFYLRFQGGEAGPFIHDGKPETSFSGRVDFLSYGAHPMAVVAVMGQKEKVLAQGILYVFDTLPPKPPPSIEAKVITRNEIVNALRKRGINTQIEFYGNWLHYWAISLENFISFHKHWTAYNFTLGHPGSTLVDPKYAYTNRFVCGDYALRYMAAARNWFPALTIMAVAGNPWWTAPTPHGFNLLLTVEKDGTEHLYAIDTTPFLGGGFLEVTESNINDLGIHWILLN